MEVPAGYEAQYLRSEDGKSFLCYLRNIAGTTPIQADPAAGWTRSRAKARLEVSLHIPLQARQLRIADLDDGTIRTVAHEGTRPISLGVTDHDVGLFADDTARGTAR